MFCYHVVPSQKRIANTFYVYLFIFRILCGIVCQSQCVDVKFMLNMDVVDWPEQPEQTEDSGSNALSV